MKRKLPFLEIVVFYKSIHTNKASDEPTAIQP